MITTDTFNKERTDYQAMYNRRELDIVWTTTPIQTLRSTYTSSDLIQLVFQRSRHMIQIGQVGISFRPIINYGSNTGVFGSLAKKMMLCLGATQASDYIVFQGATIENNQICSQANISLIRPRNIIQNVFNNMKRPQKHGFSPEHYETGVIYSAGNGSSNTGFQEVSVTHPYVVQGTTNLAPSRFEGDTLPRALISRQFSYNMDFCPAVANQGGANCPSNEYFGPTVSANADLPVGNQLAPQTGQFNYPLLPLAITPSVACYKLQQERWQHFRQRFITAYVGPFSDPSLAYNQFGQTYCINQTNINETQALAQKVIYGQPVQGPIAGTNGIQLGSSTGQSIARYTGTPMTAAGGAYAPPEKFTNCLVTIGETAIEFNPEFGIDMLAMDSSQLIVQYQVNRPEMVLCSYLQSGLFQQGAAGAGPNAAACQAFLNACMLPSDVSFVLTDLCLRVPYLTYNDPDAYALVRQMCYEPQSYYSLRAQQDVINTGSQFFQRLAIGGSSLLAGIFVFIVPAQSGPKKGSGPVDTVVSYCSASPLPIGDLRSQPSWDSYYVQMSDFYVQVDNKRYTVNAIPVSSPEFSTYMYVNSNLEMAFGKTLGIPFEQFVLNRAVYFCPINPNADRSLIIQDQTCIVSFSLNFADREAYSTSMGESVTSCNGQFSALTYAVTINSLVDCKNIRTA